jgi:hypothetical protein
MCFAKVAGCIPKKALPLNRNANHNSGQFEMANQISVAPNREKNSAHGVGWLHDHNTNCVSRITQTFNTLELISKAEKSITSFLGFNRL